MPNSYSYGSSTVFDTLISYSNDKGAESVETNNVQFRNFLVWDQYSVGIETRTLPGNQQANGYQKMHFYNEQTGPLVADSIIIGNSLNQITSITKSGVVIARDRGQLFSNISFFNFPDPFSHAIRSADIQDGG